MITTRKSLFLVLLFFLSPLSAQLSLEGLKTQGGLLTGRVEPGARIIQNGVPVQVSPQGLFLLGFGRDHPPMSEIKIIFPDGRQELKHLQISERTYQIQRIDGLPKSKVTPDKMDLKRIRRENAMVKRARQEDDARTDFLSGWIWPVTGPISGIYGSQRILNGKPRRPHYGVDIAAPVGTRVRAPADGIVTLTHPDMFFSGGTLIIDHGHNLNSSFLHLSKILVKKGDLIKQGDIIAEVGKSGRVTGAHLDWRMNIHQHRIDPQLLVPQMKQLGGL